MNTDDPKQEMSIDAYEGISDEDLVNKLEFLVKRYKEKKQKMTPSNTLVP